MVCSLVFTESHSSSTAPSSVSFNTWMPAAIISHNAEFQSFQSYPIFIFSYEDHRGFCCKVVLSMHIEPLKACRRRSKWWIEKFGIPQSKNGRIQEVGRDDVSHIVLADYLSLQNQQTMQVPTISVTSNAVSSAIFAPLILSRSYYCSISSQIAPPHPPPPLSFFLVWLASAHLTIPQLLSLSQTGEIWTFVPPYCCYHTWNW